MKHTGFFFLTALSARLKRDVPTSASSLCVKMSNYTAPPGFFFSNFSVGNDVVLFVLEYTCYYETLTGLWCGEIRPCFDLN